MCVCECVSVIDDGYQEEMNERMINGNDESIPIVSEWSSIKC